MRTFEALELEPDDFTSDEKYRAAVLAMAHVELVTYKGEVVKHRNGKMTRPLFAMRRAVEVSEDGNLVLA